MSTTVDRKRAVGRASYQRRKTDPDIRLYRIWNNARQRAPRRGLPFAITLEWVRSKIEQGHCEASGLEFDLSVGEGSGHGHPFAPSLDQTVPGLGYTPENTRAVCWLYNCAKGVASDADVLKLAKALVQAATPLNH